MRGQVAPFAVPPVPLRRHTIDGPICRPANASVPLELDDYHELSTRRRLLHHPDAGDATPPPPVIDAGKCLPVTQTPKIIFSAIHSSSQVVGALTTVTISLQFNTDLEPGVLITIAGLGQTSTPDDDAIPIRVMAPPTIPGAGASLFVGKDGAWDSGVWRRVGGLLMLQVASWARVKARHVTVLTLLLRNPPAPWVGDTPRIYVSHGVGSDGRPGGGSLQIGPVVAGNRLGEVAGKFSYLQPDFMRLVPKTHPTLHPVLRQAYFKQVG